MLSSKLTLPYVTHSTRVLSFEQQSANLNGAFIKDTLQSTGGKPMRRIEAEFEKALHDLCHEARSIGYNPIRFQQMLAEQGALATAHQLLAPKGFHDGFTRLWELKRLDISLECVVLSPTFRPLFSTEELDEARRRLRELHFDPCRCEQVSISSQS